MRRFSAKPENSTGGAMTPPLSMRRKAFIMLTDIAGRQTVATTCPSTGTAWSVIISSQ